MLKSFPDFFPIENRKTRSTDRYRLLGKKPLLFLPRRIQPIRLSQREPAAAMSASPSQLS
jgi:hypothetical protein